MEGIYNFIIEYFEIIAAVLGFFYVILEVLQKSWMWYLWFFTSIAYFLFYVQNDIYAMMLLQIYNAFVCIYGIIQWKKTKEKVQGSKKLGYKIGDDNEEEEILIVRKLHPKMAIWSIVVSLVVFVVMAIILNRYTNDASPWLDSGVTTLCMLATFYLSRQNIENWYVWIVCNVVSVYFYLTLKMYPTTILYALYVLMATLGLFHWKKKGIEVD